MANIAYALAGEGRGHATRARTVSQALLEKGHQIVFLTGDDGYDFLHACYKDDPRVRFVQIPVLHFVFRNTRTLKRRNRGALKKVSPLRMAKSVLKFAWNMGGEAEKAARAMTEMGFDPDVVLTDFEPIGWRVARRMGKPLVTLDNQHFFYHAKLSMLPYRQWPFVMLIQFICFLMAPTKKAAIVAKFTPGDFTRENKNLYTIGPLIRPEIKEAAAQYQEDGDFILCYLRPSVAEYVINALRNINLPTHIYGAGERPPEGNLTFCAVSATDFARDLVQSKMVITSAGNQTIGECFYLRKKMFAIPEPGQMEQEVNTWLACKFGAMGGRLGIEKKLRQFFEEARHLEYPFEGEDASQRAVEIIEGIIENSK